MPEVSGFIAIFPTVVLAWILVELWSNVINVIAYKTLELDANSAYHVFGVAVFVSLCLFFVMCLHSSFDNSTSVSYVQPTSFSSPG